jgi:hypothetical protein
MHLNERWRFYYRFLNGDKDTFHMAWRMTGQPYARPARPLSLLPPCGQPKWPVYWGPVLAQPDFEGQLLFQHRSSPKWVLFGNNPHYPRFRYENECLGFLQELAELWDGRMSTAVPSLPETHSPHSRWFRYVRLSCDEKLLEFLPNGRIGNGSTRFERLWRLLRRHANTALHILGEGFLTCRLLRQSDGVWRGPWEHFEQNPVELFPLPGAANDSRIWRNPRSWLSWRPLAGSW